MFRPPFVSYTFSALLKSSCSSLHHMSHKDRSRNTSNSPRNRCDSIYNRLCLIKLYITAEFALFIDINAHINDRLTCTKV